MKTVKNKIYENWFYYVSTLDKTISIIETHHGLYNFDNKIIGYKYQSDKRGFWLTHKKI
jgi:hypothetical protein